VHLLDGTIRCHLIDIVKYTPGPRDARRGDELAGSPEFSHFTSIKRCVSRDWATFGSQNTATGL